MSIINTPATETLKRLSALFEEALNRCNQCSHGEDLFWCDDCQQARREFENIMGELINMIVPDKDWRILHMIELMAQYPVYYYGYDDD